MLHVVIATGNRHKFNELAKLLAVPGVRWHALAEYGRAPAMAETGKTFDANAIKKARAIARWTGHLALADDSGLEVEALKWGPGVRSARFAGRHGDDEANNAKLLRALSGLPPLRRRARYRCSLALAAPSRLIAVTRGTWYGRIAPEPAGRHGFGYDPMFFVPRFGKTVGQLAPSVKRRLSHRAAAARGMRSTLVRLSASQRTRQSPSRGSRVGSSSSRSVKTPS